MARKPTDRKLVSIAGKRRSRKRPAPVDLQTETALELRRDAQARVLMAVVRERPQRRRRPRTRWTEPPGFDHAARLQDAERAFPNETKTRAWLLWLSSVWEQLSEFEKARELTDEDDARAFLACCYVVDDELRAKLEELSAEPKDETPGQWHARSRALQAAWFTLARIAEAVDAFDRGRHLEAASHLAHAMRWHAPPVLAVSSTKQALSGVHAGRVSGEQRRSEAQDETDSQVRKIALKNRAVTPWSGDRDASTRWLARTISEQTGMPFETVRASLRRQDIR